ncbi:hypothetical protein HK102_009777 [Quaeritorhiza haematococci]|nr:hypothetical protein HK102_009777 [Quaeritorhiza haematococci]
MLPRKKKGMTRTREAAPSTASLSLKHALICLWKLRHNQREQRTNNENNEKGENNENGEPDCPIKVQWSDLRVGATGVYTPVTKPRGRHWQAEPSPESDRVGRADRKSEKQARK